MTITSRIIEKPLSGIARDTASDIEIANASGLAVDVSSMLETVTRGGLVEPPPGDIVFSGFELEKNPIPKTVTIHWHTDVATKGRSCWRIYGSSDEWKITTLSLNYATTHQDNTSMPCAPGAVYEYRVYGIDENGYPEWDILRYVKISESGEPVPYGG